MLLAILLDEKGRQIRNPEVQTGNLSFKNLTGEAQFFNDQNRLVAELKSARVLWIEAGGIRIEGVEHYDLRGEKIRVQHWHISFSPQEKLT